MSKLRDTNRPREESSQSTYSIGTFDCLQRHD